MCIITVFFFSYKSSQLDAKVCVLGKIEVKSLAHEMHMVNTYYNTQATTAPIFLRWQRDDEIFFSQQYTRVKVRNSYTVSYINDDSSLSYGQIMYYVYMKDRPTAMISMLHTLPVPESFLQLYL